MQHFIKKSTEMAMEFVLTSSRKVILFIVIILVNAAIAFVLWGDLKTGKIPRSADKVVPSERFPVLSNDPVHLHVFVQISDLHISIFRDLARGPDFRNFCERDLQVIKPEVVLATGDLTDAKYRNREGSMQYEEEWKDYQRILRETKIIERTVWLDIRGNHDAFDVPGIDSTENMFRVYSQQGPKHSRSYSYIHNATNGDSIGFVAVDATPDIGPRRPFNFFGVTSTEENEKLDNLMRNVNKNSNVTVAFGHYPTSVIAGPVGDLRTILGGASVYLSGHLHTLGDHAKNMYARQNEGFLELELGDWMDNRLYRVFVVDHGMFSFVDVPHGTWPVILVTNPKHGQFAIPGKESEKIMLRSTHIRVLVFSPNSIANVSVAVDGQVLGTASHVKDALYTLPWKPQEYATGKHIMKIVATESNGKRTESSQPFTLDGTPIPFDLFRRFLLMSQHAVETKVMFALAFIATVLPLIIINFVHVTLEVSDSCSCFHSLFQAILRKYKMLANNKTIYWPLMIFHAYVSIGPWFIGEVIKGHIGCMFTFGVYIQGTFIPGSLTYLYAFFQLALFNFPLSLYLGHILDLKASSHKRQPPSSKLARICRWFAHHGLFYLMLLWQTNLAVFGFFRAYGLMAVLLCPVRTWSVVFALILRRVARKNGPKLSETCET